MNGRSVYDDIIMIKFEMLILKKLLLLAPTKRHFVNLFHLKSRNYYYEVKPLPCF